MWRDGLILRDFCEICIICHQIQHRNKMCVCELQRHVFSCVVVLSLPLPLLVSPSFSLSLRAVWNIAAAQQNKRKTTYNSK